MEIRLGFTERQALVLDHHGDVLFPQTYFLNEGQFRYSDKTGAFLSSGAGIPNPNTQQSQFMVLQALEYFFTLNGFTIEENIATQGVYFESHQAMALRDWMALPLNRMASLKSMRANITELDHDNRRRAIRLAASEGKKLKPLEKVSRNTQNQRLAHLRGYLATHYQIFSRYLYGRDPKQLLKNELISALQLLKVKAPKVSGHQGQIVSFPMFRWVQVLDAIVHNPEQAFLTESGHPAKNLCRHQAVALMCADGLRFGAVAFAAAKDIDHSGMYSLDPSNRDLWIEEEGGIRNANVPALKNHVEVGLAFQLKPVTTKFVNDYMTHRAIRLKRLIGNRSKGLLFIDDFKGTPLEKRHVRHTFNCLKRGLDKMGLLDVDASDLHSKSKKKYECRAHVFRHSGVCDFAFAWLQNVTLSDEVVRRLCDEGEEKEFRQIAEKTAAKHLGGLVEAVRTRFGWSNKSTMPTLYAQRVLKEVTDKFKHDRAENIFGDTDAVEVQA